MHFFVIVYPMSNCPVLQTAMFIYWNIFLDYWICGGLYLLLYCTYSLWRKFNCVKIPEGEANKSANRWGSFGAKGGVVPPSVQFLTCADQTHFILHDFAAYFYLRHVHYFYCHAYTATLPPTHHHLVKLPSAFVPLMINPKIKFGFLNSCSLCTVQRICRTGGEIMGSERRHGSAIE